MTAEALDPPASESASPDAAPPLEIDRDRLAKLSRRLRNRWLLRGFMLGKLPLGLAAGLRIDELDTHRCRTSLPYGWRTTNPFRSIYFAAQAMAAELSTGAPAMLAVELAPSPVAMLIVDLHAEFGKKANRRTSFVCADVAELFRAVSETLATGEPALATVETVGRMDDATEVSRFRFTWSFKRRS